MYYTTIKASEANVPPTYIQGWHWAKFVLAGFVVEAYKASNKDQDYLRYLNFKIGNVEKIPAGRLANGNKVHDTLYSCIVYAETDSDIVLPSAQEVEDAMSLHPIPSGMKVNEIVGGYQFHMIW